MIIRRQPNTKGWLDCTVHAAQIPLGGAMRLIESDREKALPLMENIGDG